MNGTQLGTCQVIFARREYDVHVDLVLAGTGSVEGYPLVPGSPVSVALVPPAEPWARRRMMRLLRSWADDAAACTAQLSLDDDLAVLVLSSGPDTLFGELTDLDVVFAEDEAHQPSEQ